jgi:hypothetical protein
MLAMGIEAAPHLHLSVMKLMRIAPGAGRQMLHFDIPSTVRVHSRRGDEGTQKASQCYSCILHLSSGDAQGTHLPILSAERMQPVLTAKKTGVGLRDEIARLCHPDNFHSHLMHSGDLLVFRDDVPHYGPANGSTSEWRWVLFVLFSPVPGPDQDGTQEFIHCSEG